MDNAAASGCPDVVLARPHLFLGTLLKRLGEQLQADVLGHFEREGYPIQPGQAPLLAALAEAGPLTVGELVSATGVSQPGVTRTLARLIETGLVETRRSEQDSRAKSVALTEAGRRIVARCLDETWPLIESEAGSLAAESSGPLIARLRAMSASLQRRPFGDRLSDAADVGLRIRPFSDALAPAFHAINAAWIEALFTLEETDRDVLTRPRETILATGGDILFVEARGLGIVGTCALQRTGPGQFELTKLGVSEAARGRKAGEFLLRATIRRAWELGATCLYLLSNQKNRAAIHLFEKTGFVHDDGIMRTFGARYARCNVAMLWRDDPL